MGTAGCNKLPKPSNNANVLLCKWKKVLKNRSEVGENDFWNIISEAETVHLFVTVAMTQFYILLFSSDAQNSDLY